MGSVRRHVRVRPPVPAGYASGPDAPLRATQAAVARLDGAASAVLVEGVSDQAAVEAAAAARGVDLERARVVVVPIGGAHAVGRFLTRLGPRGAGLRLAGLYDVGEEAAIRRGLAASTPGAPPTHEDLERLGFFACDRDLEDELIRAVGAPAVLDVLETQGELTAFRTLQRQPAWRSGELEAQLRRFFGSRAGRKLRYARLLTQVAARDDALPRPLAALLEAVAAAGVGPPATAPPDAERPGGCDARRAVGDVGQV